MKLLSVGDSIYLFFFHMVLWSFILGQGWLLNNNFCISYFACQKCLHLSSEFKQFDELREADA